MRGPAVSDAIEKESTAAQELGQRPGSAQGEGTARALRRPTQKRETSGPREKNWASGPKARRKEIFFFFFLFNITKHFQLILNPNLNLNQTTHYKNSNATA
jgi:hypothetical protein